MSLLSPNLLEILSCGHPKTLLINRYLPHLPVLAISANDVIILISSCLTKRVTSATILGVWFTRWLGLATKNMWASSNAIFQILVVIQNPVVCVRVKNEYLKKDCIDQKEKRSPFVRATFVHCHFISTDSTGFQLTQ